MRRHYDVDNETFGADAYTIEGEVAVGWYVLGWETEPDEDTDWSGYEVRTGRIVAVMIGDDRHFVFDPEDAKPLARAAYCGECGQMGCTHDGLNRPLPDDGVADGGEPYTDEEIGLMDRAGRGTP